MPSVGMKMFPLLFDGKGHPLGTVTLLPLLLSYGNPPISTRRVVRRGCDGGFRTCIHPVRYHLVRETQPERGGVSGRYYYLQGRQT